MLLIPTCLPVLVLLLLPGQAEDPAAELWEQAQAAAAAGRYKAADRLYEKIIEAAPQSDQAGEARRRLQPNALLRVVELERNGDPEQRIDVFVMAEGFSREAKHQKIFDQAAEGTLTYFQQAPVFRRYRKYFNFYAMNIASLEDGVDRPGKEYDTALGAFESGATQGQVAVDHQQVETFLRMDPRAEGLAVVIVRLGTLGTGGGGVAVVGGAPSNTIIHEWGHAFGRLLDEYTSDVGYTGKTPRGVNVSDSPDPERAPWKHWLDAGTKGVGMFPGGAGRSQGAWRAMASGCAMSRGPSYCLVCRESVVAHIYERVGPIDRATPNDQPIVIASGAQETIGVTPMEVSGAPGLRVRFTLEETQERFAAQAVQPATGGGLGLFDEGEDVSFDGGGGGSSWRRQGSRFGKGADPPLKGRDFRVSKQREPDRSISYQVTLSSRDAEPGNYLLHASVVDPTDWVLKPEWLNLLSETRTWQITIQ